MKKRTQVVLAAIFAGAVSIQQKKNEAECKDNTPCATEPAATVPEQPDSSEDRPGENTLGVEKLVYRPMSSPIESARKGSKAHRDWVRNGEKVWEMDDSGGFVESTDF
jgi:hypothetical protein